MKDLKSKKKKEGFGVYATPPSLVVQSMLTLEREECCLFNGVTLNSSLVFFFQRN